jgi:hypothetical protein
MKSRWSWLSGITLVASVALGGCASYSYDESRTITEQRLIEQPKNNDPTEYQTLQIAWGKLADDHGSIPFTIAQQSLFDQFNQTTQVTQSRQNINSDLAQAGIFVPFGILSCAVDSTANCATTQYGTWQEVSAAGAGPPVPTGKTVSKVLPLAKSYPGKLVVTGFDADGRELGSFKASFVFQATNTLRFGDLVNAFANRPDHLKLEAHFTTKKQDETLPLTLSGGLADNSRLNFGDYAWLNPEQALRAKMAKLQAEHAAEQRAEEAQRAAEEQQETDQNTAIVGALMGGMVAAQTGNAAAGSLIAQMAGVDKSTADAISQGFAQQQQQINTQYQQQMAALQQQEAALAAQRQSNAQVQAVAVQQHAVQVALIEQQNAQQQAQAQAAQQAAFEAQQKVNDDAATQRKAFATQCLRASSDFVDAGGFQHVVMGNSCADDVWALLKDNQGNGEGGVVDSGQTREFVFKNRGAGWIRRYWGCIAKYDVDRECVGQTGGLGAY